MGQIVSIYKIIRSMNIIFRSSMNTISKYRDNIFKSYPFPTARYLKRNLLFFDRFFNEVFLFKFTFFHKPLFLLTDMLEKDRRRFVVWILRNQTTGDGFLEDAIA